MIPDRLRPTSPVLNGRPRLVRRLRATTRRERRSRLDQDGFVVVPGFVSRAAARRLLRSPGSPSSAALVERRLRASLALDADAHRQVEAVLEVEPTDGRQSGRPTRADLLGGDPTASRLALLIAVGTPDVGPCRVRIRPSRSAHLARSRPITDVRSRVEAELLEVQLELGDCVVLAAGSEFAAVPGHFGTLLRSTFDLTCPPTERPSDAPSDRDGGARATVGALSSALDQDGFATVGFLDPATIDAAREIFDALELDDGHGFFVGRRDHPGERAASVNRRLQDLLGNRVVDFFPGYRTVFATFCSKGRNSDNVVSYHHDPMFTDEREHRGLLIWCPLVDCDRSTGVLKVVPGSHRWTDRIRPSESWNVGEVVGLPEVLDRLAVDEAMWAGDALVLDGATIHGSGPNAADRDRPAVVLFLVPDHAPLIVFHADEQRSITGHEVDDRFFLEHDMRLPPSGYDTVEPWGEAITTAIVADAALGQAASLEDDPSVTGGPVSSGRAVGSAG